MAEKLVYSVKEAADLLGVNERSLRNAINRGEVPHTMIGSRVLVPRYQLYKKLGIPTESEIKEEESTEAKRVCTLSNP